MKYSIICLFIVTTMLFFTSCGGNVNELSSIISSGDESLVIDSSNQNSYVSDNFSSSTLSSNITVSSGTSEYSSNNTNFSSNINSSNNTNYSSNPISSNIVSSNVENKEEIPPHIAYASHPKLPLYGDNEIPYYIAEYSARSVGDGSGGTSYYKNDPYIVPYIVEGSKSCVLVFPGGGYSIRNDWSCTNVCKMFNSKGITAFLVMYRIGNGANPEDGYWLDPILSDGQRAVQYVRYNADKFGIDANQIAIFGFSAGGHLATMVSQNEHTENVVGDSIGDTSNIPNAVLLAYPCTTLKSGAYPALLPILSGGDVSIQNEISDKYSGELNITKNTPPTFIFYGTADTTVSYQSNSIRYYDALRQANVYTEIYEYSGFYHGQNLGSATQSADWHNKAISFLKKLNFTIN